jgi:hypothetical protein
MTAMSSQPPRFNPYDDNVGPNDKTRRIDQQAPRADEGSWQQDVAGSNWRSERRRGTTPTSTPSPSGRMPVVTQQRVASWLTNGGWKILAGAAVALVVLLIFMLLTNTRDNTTQGGLPTTLPGANTGLNGVTPGQLNVGVEPTTAPATDPNQPATDPNQPAVDPNQPAAGARLAVAGTGTEGLFLRDNPGGNILKTLPEGTAVEKLGEQNIDGVLWFNIREPGGLSGWSSSAFLAPAP